MRARCTGADCWAFATGAFTALVQAVLLREALSVAGGNELATAMSFLGWFGGTALGAALSSRGLTRVGRPLPMSVVCLAMSVLGFLFLRLHRPLLGLSVGMDVGLVGVLVLPASGLSLGGLTAGVLFTLSARQLSSGGTAPVGRFYAVEATGALVGALCFFGLSAPWATHLAALGAAGGVLFAGAAAWEMGKRRLLAALFAAMFFATVLSGRLGQLDNRLERLVFETLTSAAPTAVRESAYGRLVLTESDGQFELWQDGRYSVSFPDPYDRPVPVHLALSLLRRPSNVLIVGGGVPDRLAAALMHRPRRVVFTYLNPDSVEIGRPYYSESTLDAMRDPRVVTVNEDGRRYIGRTAERFDAVLVFAPPPRTVGENRYHTRAFYEDARRILNPGGRLVVFAPGGAGAMAPEALASAAATYSMLRSVFSDVRLVAGLETLFLAGEGGGNIDMDPDAAATRFAQRVGGAASFSIGRFRDILNGERRARRLAALKRELERPAAELPLRSVYAANLRLWERTTGAVGEWVGRRSLLGALSSFAIWFALIPAFLTAGYRLLLGRRGPGPKGAASVSTATTGAAGMAGQLAILSAFQSELGTLYIGIVLMSGTFMAGLAAGATLGRKWGASGSRKAGTAVESAMIAFLMLSAVLLEQGGLRPPFFYCWSALLGGLTGAAFPVFLGTAARAHAGDERAAAARIEFSDHAGAAFGAVAMGLVWLPTYGISISCMILAAFKLLSLLFFATARMSGATNPTG